MRSPTCRGPAIRYARQSPLYVRKPIAMPVHRGIWEGSRDGRTSAITLKSHKATTIVTAELTPTITLSMAERPPNWTPSGPAGPNPRRGSAFTGPPRCLVVPEQDFFLEPTPQPTSEGSEESRLRARARRVRAGAH